MTILLGIDPGENGAFVIINKKTNEILEAQKFFTFGSCLSVISNYKIQIAGLEQVNNQAGWGSRTADSLIRNAGGWEGFLAALQISYEKSTPTVWQKIVPQMPAASSPKPDEDSKAKQKRLREHRNKCKEHITKHVIKLYPSLAKILTVKKNWDIADAVMIGEFAFNKRGEL